MTVIIVCCFPMVIKSLREIREFFLEGFDFSAVGQNSERMQQAESRANQKKNQKSELVNKIINACVNRKFEGNVHEE
jgi:hypothetical protein